MVRLRLFGSPSLEREDGAAITGRAGQRHRLALLALLSLAPAHRISRDKLIAWLWPEADDEHGRNLLNVSIYVLRAALGEGAIVSEGDDLRLDPGLVRSDVAEFEAAVARGDPAGAVELHAGPFLDGFFLAEAPEFEQWTERERQRLGALSGKGLEALAERAEAAGDFRAAVERWRVRAAHDPYDSRVALRLMQALDGGGNRAGAIQHAALHQRRLQDELGVTTAPEVAALAERLRHEPARPVAATVVAAPADGQAAAEPPRGRFRPAAAVVAFLSLGLVAWLAFSRSDVPARSIVVLPFASMTSGGERDYFADGLTDEIITGLATVPELTVISRTSAMRYGTSVAPLPEIARELNVANVLHGTVRRDGDRARVSAQLVKAEGERVLWAGTYESELRDILRIQEQIAQDVVRALELELGGDTRRALVRRGTQDGEAYELYQRGRFLWSLRTPESMRQAVVHFERAIARDSGFAGPYAGLADAYLVSWQFALTDLSEAEARARLTWAAERAVALDDASADAHTSLAVALWWRQNWPGAERELRRAIALNPNYATARGWYSILLSGFGRQEEALREARRAAQLDPYALIIVLTYAWQCYLSREWECAEKQYERTLEINPAWTVADRQMAVSYALQGRHAEARRRIEKVVEAEPAWGATWADLAIVQALAGDPAAAWQSIRRAIRHSASKFQIGRAYAALGERDSALAALNQSTLWVWPHRAVLADPALDPLRSDPRLARLAERIEREMGVR